MPHPPIARPSSGVYLMENVYARNMAAVDPYRGQAMQERVASRQRNRSHANIEHSPHEEAEVEEFGDSIIVARTDDLDIRFLQVP
jgi:hypothetical protein